MITHCSFPVKVPSKRHTQVNSSVVSTISKSPKLFNNKPVNKLVFLVLITTTTSTTTITALQIATKAKNSKKPQQIVTTAMVTPNPFVVPDKILEKISTAAVSSFPNMDDNSNGTSHKIKKDKPQAVLFDKVLSGRFSSVIEAKQFIILDNLKDWADQMEMESTVSPPVFGTADGGAWKNVNESLNGAITLKIAWSSGVVSVSSLPLFVALCDILLSTSSDDIKAALGIFGVVISVKLKPAGLWQYAVVHLKDISSAAETLKHWFVLVKKNSVRILLVVNQREFVPNFTGGSKVFKSLFAKAKSYAKAVVFVVPAAAGIDSVLNLPSKVVVPMVPDISPVPIAVVESRLASMKSHLNELALLVKFIIKPVGFLVVLVTKLLSTSSAVNMTLRESVVGLERQVKAVAAVASMLNRDVKFLTKKCDRISLKDVSNNDNMDNDNNEVKDFSVYDDTFDMMMQL
ncbi:hypothetical protein G9A89_008522 [Geosiphon pyriformis]|nr:hypothetical protein G9A89_008522 [Geosiphon pyriformis]